MKAVSIIIPIYQVSDYVERCLKSVIGQTFKDIECILVDDVTKDDSLVKCERIIRDYNEKEGKISFKILHHERNRGLSAARNTGTKAATGEYIYYMDSDDEITPDCIEKLMRTAREHPEAEMVIGNYREFWMDKELRTALDNSLPSHICSNESVFSYYIQRSLPDSAWNKLVRRDFIENHGLEFKEGIIYEDFHWMFYVVKYLTEVCQVKDVTYYYYRRPGSILSASDNETIGISFCVIYDDVLCHLTQGRERKELRRFLGGFCKRYLDYKKIVPAYKDLYREYRNRARQYDRWLAYVVLGMTGVIGVIGRPKSLMEALYTLRWKMK